mgnify:FL=1
MKHTANDGMKNGARQCSNMFTMILMQKEYRWNSTTMKMDERGECSKEKKRSKQLNATICHGPIPNSNSDKLMVRLERHEKTVRMEVFNLRFIVNGSQSHDLTKTFGKNCSFRKLPKNVTR